MSTVFRDGLLDGQLAIVTGAGSGIGRVTALELASLGMTVVAVGRRPEPLEETVALASSGRVEARACDIRDPDQVEVLLDGVLADHERVDLLVNNAGGQFLAPAEQISPKGFQTVMRLNVEGTWSMTHAVATRSMIPAGGGKVVSVTLSPHHGLAGMAHSSAARAAVENLMRVLSIEWARFNIRLNSVAPGIIGTDTFMTKYPPEMVESSAASVPLGRVGQAEDVAWLITYLASPAGDYVSGTVLTVDGGLDNHHGAWPPPGRRDAEGRPLIEQRPGATSS